MTDYRGITPWGGILVYVEATTIIRILICNECYSASLPYSELYMSDQFTRNCIKV